MIDSATEARNSLEKETTGTVQYHLIRREEIELIFTAGPGGQYTFEEFKAFIGNRLGDEEDITRFQYDRGKIRFMVRFLDGDAAKWWNVTMKSDSFAASNCQIEFLVGHGRKIRYCETPIWGGIRIASARRDPYHGLQ